MHHFTFKVNAIPPHGEVYGRDVFYFSFTFRLNATPIIFKVNATGIFSRVAFTLKIYSLISFFYKFKKYIDNIAIIVYNVSRTMH
jgi:hypothetical protein